MSVNYASVLWNDQKKTYDKILWAGILLCIISYAGFHLFFHPETTIETVIIRATALTAFILLHIILVIGPLCRINSLFLPLLYNRRHMGVSMFSIALIHGVFSIIQFHALGDTNPLVSIFTSNQNYSAISDFPFQTLGFFALLILFFIAATSHDFWLKNLSPRIWKALHMSVYIAYGLIVLHVVLGALQYESHPIYWAMLIGGFTSISGLHLYSGLIENRRLAADKNALEKMGFTKLILSRRSMKNVPRLFLSMEKILPFLNTMKKYRQFIMFANNKWDHSAKEKLLMVVFIAHGMVTNIYQRMDNPLPHLQRR